MSLIGRLRKDAQSVISTSAKNKDCEWVDAVGYLPCAAKEYWAPAVGGQKPEWVHAYVIAQILADMAAQEAEAARNAALCAVAAHACFAASMAAVVDRSCLSAFYSLIRFFEDLGCAMNQEAMKTR